MRNAARIGFRDEAAAPAKGYRVSTITMIGLTAAFLTTFAYLPQVLKTFRTRSAEDISLGMLTMMSTGIVLWLVYGVFILDPPLIGANAVSLTMVGYILYAKLRYARVPIGSVAAVDSV